MSKYLVGIGGSPPDQRKEYDNFDDALDAAYDMAVEMAEDEHLDPDDIRTWHGDGRPTEGGACPSNNDGAYWPCVVRK